MNMSMSEQSPERQDEFAADPLEEELVAYLDGELDADAARCLEERLANDPELRRRLNELQAAWELLEELPASEADPAFTHTTVSMVAVRAGQETRRLGGWRLAAGVLLGCATALLAGLIGYWSVDYFLSAPERQLARDWPVIERVDMYRSAESVEFLRKLVQEGIFDDVGSQAP
jgi:anti-sigma factor RsiW